MLTNIRDHAPSRLLPTFASIRVEFDSETLDVFPVSQAAPGGGGIISIPHGFPRMMCLMVQWSSRMLALRETDLTIYIAISMEFQRQCSQRSSAGQCFFTAMELAPTWEALQRDSLGDRGPAFIESALFHVIAHEVGHLAINDARTRERVIESTRIVAENELRADIFAIRALIVRGGEFRGAYYAMLPLQVLSLDAEGQRIGDPASPLCRAQLVQRLYDRIAPQIAAVYGWVLIGPPDQHPPDPSTLPAVAARIRSELAPLVRIDPALHCTGLDAAALERVGTDYDELLTTIGAITSEGMADRPEMFERAARHRFADADVRDLLASLLAVRLTLLEVRAANDLIARQVNARSFAVLLRRFDPAGLGTFARAALNLYAAANLFDLAPPGSRLDDIVGRTYAQLRDAESFLADSRTWAVLQIRLAELELLRGNCAQSFDRARPLLRAEAQATGSPPPALPSVTPDGCRQLTRDARARLRRERGWR